MGARAHHQRGSCMARNCIIVSMPGTDQSPWPFPLAVTVCKRVNSGQREMLNNTYLCYQILKIRKLLKYSRVLWSIFKIFVYLFISLHVCRVTCISACVKTHTQVQVLIIHEWMLWRQRGLLARLRDKDTEPALHQCSDTVCTRSAIEILFAADFGIVI